MSGVDFWWLDWQQEKFTRSLPQLENLRWLNELYFRHTSRDGTRGCSFSRWAGWGDHRHPVHFSGDAHTGWESLAFQVEFTSTAGNVGCFFWSHDIGGHFGPRLEEATTRWVQFGALSPVLRLHSARSGALDRRPWTYRPEYEAAMRSAFRLRAELFPYLYTMARKCHTEMLPLCRPMYLDWPEEEAAYENPQQYMLGDDLLVAPITSPGVGPRRVATQAVWFPGTSSTTSPTRERGGAHAPDFLAGASGSYWYNWFTGERYEAGTEQLVAAEIDEIPLFLPGGVPIVTREPTLRMATAPLEKLVIVCYPGEAGTYHEFDLYEDDGISDAHERGEYSTTPVRVWWLPNEVKVEVGIRVGSFAGMARDREVVLELRGVERANWVRVDDTPRGTVEGAGGRVRIADGKLGADQVVRFALRFEAAHRNAALMESFHRRITGVVGADWEPAAEIWESPGVKALSESELARFRGVFGEGLRRDGDVLHVYNMAHARLTLEDSLGDRVMERRQLDMGPGALSQRVRLPDGAGTPSLGLVARRVVAVEAEGQRMDRFVLQERRVPLGSFRILGPFRYNPTQPMAAQQHGPEHVRAGKRADGIYTDLHAKPTTWRDVPADDYWPQNMRILGGHAGEALAYALTHVWSPQKQEVTLILESGDRLELWLDDAKVFSSDTAPEAKTGTDEVRVTLRKGWNQIMGKTNEGGGGWGFRVAIDGKYELRESFEAR